MPRRMVMDSSPPGSARRSSSTLSGCTCSILPGMIGAGTGRSSTRSSGRHCRPRLACRRGICRCLLWLVRGSGAAAASADDCERSPESRPERFVRNLRLRCARELLTGGASDLDAIAAEVRLSSGQVLCRSFRREFGLTPAAYWRKAHRRAFPRPRHGCSSTSGDADEGSSVHSRVPETASAEELEPPATGR